MALLRSARRDDGGDSDGASTLKTGVVAGFVATVVMTAFREPTARSLPPTSNFLSRWLGGDSEDYPISSVLLHLAYGVGGGVAFGFGWTRRGVRTDEPETVGLILGSLYGVALSLFGEHVVLKYLVAMELDTDESAVFHAGHLIYGLTVGVWFGSRERDDESA
ncbi:hypothetical protein NDI76_18320 [Halogeometricum sp. S1BR25-6]|uniref:Peptidase S54 rhomboid domain-containing protein n=1 Tax=Halogeometricum salsisoli TaxID=2950536 RepID=A0ABU2GIP0_9EURY|nr:hypothetical protein [Halogeometricum sp. S1BR25-6]MDS0300707.1 hypothetical protein [Halogeometricum sp. S1BR25-6]